MPGKIPGLGDFVEAARKPAASIVANSPGFVLTSDNSKDFKSNINRSIELGKDTAEAAGKELGIKAGIGILDRVHPFLGDLARSILGRQKETHKELPADTPANPKGWYSLGRQRIDPLWSFLWDIEMPDVNGMRLPNYYIEEITLGLPAATDWNVFRNGTYSYYAGFSDVGQLSLTVYEDQRLSASTYFNEWHKSIQDMDGAFRPPIEYQKTIYIYLVDNSGVEIGYFRVNGVFPLTREGHTMNSGSTDRHILQIQFSVNGMDFIPLQVSPIVYIDRTPPGKKKSGGGLFGVLDMLTSEGVPSFISSPANSVKSALNNGIGFVKSHTPSFLK